MLRHLDFWKRKWETRRFAVRDSHQWEWPTIRRRNGMGSVTFGLKRGCYCAYSMSLKQCGGGCIMRSTELIIGTVNRSCMTFCFWCGHERKLRRIICTRNVSKIQLPRDMETGCRIWPITGVEDHCGAWRSGKLRNFTRHFVICMLYIVGIYRKHVDILLTTSLSVPSVCSKILCLADRRPTIWLPVIYNHF